MLVQSCRLNLNVAIQATSLNQQRSLCKELEIGDIVFERQKPLLLVYKGIALGCGYKLDIVVKGKVIFETLRALRLCGELFSFPTRSG